MKPDGSTAAESDAAAAATTEASEPAAPPAAPVELDPTGGGLPADAVAGPGDDAAAPLYIFDSDALPSNPKIFEGLARWFPPTLGKTADPALRVQPDAQQAGGAPLAGTNLRQLIVGPPMSGAMPHLHGSAVNVLFFGLKLWVLFPPESAAFADAHAGLWFTKAHLRRFACREGGGAGDAGEGGGGGGGGAQQVPSGGSAAAAAAAADEALLRVPHYAFVQEPGDLVYVPAHWGHAVLNLADSFAVALE